MQNDREMFKDLSDEWAEEKSKERKEWADAHKVNDIDPYEDLRIGEHKCKACNQPFFLHCERKAHGEGWLTWEDMCPMCVVRFLNKEGVKLCQ